MSIKERFEKIDWPDLAKRAGKTFVQTFLSSLTIDGLLGISDKLGLKRWLLTTGLSALSAAISAVWNMAIGIVSDKAGEVLDNLGDPDPGPWDLQPDPESETEEAGYTKENDETNNFCESEE